MSVCLLHGLALLPCGISGKLTIPSKSLLSLLASCSLFCYAAIPTTCYIMPPILPCQASNPPFLANRCLAMLLLCSAPLIALLVAGEDGVCSLLEHVYCWDITISLIYFNAPIYLVKGGRLALCLVFCSTLVALVSVIPVLCSLILRSLHGWVLWGPLDSSL